MGQSQGVYKPSDRKVRIKAIWNEHRPKGPVWRLRNRRLDQEIKQRRKDIIYALSNQYCTQKVCLYITSKSYFYIVTQKKQKYFKYKKREMKQTRVMPYGCKLSSVPENGVLEEYDYDVSD